MSRIKETYQVPTGTGDGQRVALDIVSPYVPLLSRALKRSEVNGALPLARQVSRYMQNRASDPVVGEQKLAENMVSDPRWLLASYAPGSVAAFTYIQEVRPKPVERLRHRESAVYVLRQCGVTTHHDLFDSRANHPNESARYLNAAAAVVHSAVEGLDPEAYVYVEGVPYDSRGEKFLKGQCGFVPTPDMGRWGTADDAFLVAPVAVVTQELKVHYPFLNVPTPNA